MIYHKSKQVGFIEHGEANIDKILHNGNCVFIQGFNRDASGTDSVVLDGTIGADLVDWSITGDTVQNSGTYNSGSKSVTVRGVEATTNYAYFNIADFDTIAIGDSVSFVVGGTTYSLKVMKIDSNYVYVENKEV